jgi:nucleotide-binding universal stress UspA family protein
MPIRKILAPTDLSELSCTGVRLALELARSEGAEIVLYHVIGVAEGWFRDHEDLNPVRPVLDEEKRRLSAFVNERFCDHVPSEKIRQIVDFGVAYKKIVEEADFEKVDLIVMSTHGRTGFNHLLLGSVTERVIAGASCPVLTVPSSRRARMKPLAA